MSTIPRINNKPRQAHAGNPHIPGLSSITSLLSRAVSPGDQPAYNSEVSRFLQDLDAMHGVCVVLQNKAGGGTTSLSFNTETKKLCYHDGRKWIDL